MCIRAREESEGSAMGDGIDGDFTLSAGLGFPLECCQHWNGKKLPVVPQLYLCLFFVADLCTFHQDY
ncbi:Uncharacterized protein TCM_041422 [Theobroma cacao]|uniref:Uncharacterized protein n=1 Tax=Theobroma cacao TaxID=3641 RepID=A0A061GVC6_THECC|nr:Uncharacterized protein TCM_041422 [Theobroma cacao]